MKKIKILITICVLFCLTGCYNYREINQLAITSAIGISKSDDGYELAIQVINTQKQGSDGSTSGDYPKFIVYKTKGKTIQEAVRNIIMESPKRLYVNHLSLLIISEEIAKEGIDEIIDIFARDSEFRKQFMVLVGKVEDTDDIIGILTNLETLNAKNIKDSLSTDSKYLGASAVVSFEDLLATYLDDKIDLLLPSVIVEGNTKKGDENSNLEESEAKATIKLDDLAIFKDNKLVGYLDKQDSINVSTIQNEITNTIYTYKCDDGEYISIEIIDSKSDIKPNTNEEIEINIKQRANLNEVHCKIDLGKQSDLDKLQDDMEKEIEKNMLKTINKLIYDFDSDIIGFKSIIYKDKPQYYKTLVKKYDNDLLKNINFKINIDLKLYAKGNILKGL